MTSPGWFNPYREAQQPHFLPSLLGPLTLVAAPVGQIVSLQQACDQCRVDVGFDDGFVSGLIADALEMVEQNIYGGATMLATTWSVPVRHWWRRGQELKLPRPPLQGVLSVTYLDATGTTQTLAPTIYEVLTPYRLPGAIRQVPLQVWPALWPQEKWPVTVTFSAGYGAGNVPRSAQRAALLWIAAGYRNRGEVVTDEKTWEAIQRLLDQCGYGSY